MVKRAEVLHGEFPFEGRYGVLDAMSIMSST
jgi:hypothetical protein